MKKWFATLFVLLLTNILTAQFSDSVHYYAGLTASGTYNQTSTNTSYLLNHGLKLSARKESMRYNVMGKWLYGQQNGELTNNDLSSMLDVNLYKTLPHFYYWGLFSYMSSYSLKVKQQLQSGLGIAYNVIDRENPVFNISDGLLYDYSDIILDDSTREQYGTIRNSLRLQLKWDIGTLVRLGGNAFYQPSLQYGNDYIVKSDIGVFVKLRKWLSISGSLNYNEVSRTHTKNLFMSYGLVLENYF